MPRIDDVSRIRAVLERDRAWAAYALGDLSPDLVRHCEWRASADLEALVMLFRGFDPPILFAIGDPDRLAAVVPEIDPAVVSLHIPEDAVPAVSAVYPNRELHQMWRMVVDRDHFRAQRLPQPVQDALEPGPGADVETLGTADFGAIERLFADGNETVETPHFFTAQMLEQGTYRGVRQHGALIAVAGTHLFVPSLGVCAIGNVYTRRDCRGQGLAARLTSAVVTYAFSSGATTVVLNVRQANDGARRVYERLGFRRHCAFVEGLARRYPSAP